MLCDFHSDNFNIKYQFCKMTRFLVDTGSITLIVVVLMLIVVLFFLNRSRIVTHNLPSGAIPYLLYWAVLKRPADSLSIAFQFLCAGCVMFHKEGLYHGRMPLWSFVFVYEAEKVQHLLNNPVALEKAREYSVIEPFFGKGLITSDSKKWYAHRKLLTPAFHMENLKNYISVFNEQSVFLVSKLKELVHEPWIDIGPMLTSCSMDIMCEAIMGVEAHSQLDEAREYLEAVEELQNYAIYRFTRPWTYSPLFGFLAGGRRGLKLLNKVRNFTSKTVKEWKENSQMKTEGDVSNGRSSGSKEEANESEIYSRRWKKSFLELLFGYHMKDPSFTLVDLQEEVDTFMYAGHDTTSVTMRWIIFMLGLHPEVQEEVIKELDSIFGSDTQREATYEDFNKMKYMECVIKETLRLYPTIPVIGRTLQETTQIGEYTVPKGSTVAIIIYMLHRNPAVFPNPEKFDPDRFLPENAEGRSPYAYIPFSAGARNCIGQKFALMEIKVVLSHILRNFRLMSLDCREKVIVSWEVILKNTAPIRVRLIPRNS